MDIFLGTWYTVRKVTLAWLRDVYRTRRVLKYTLETHFMRSAVPVLVILSLTQANQTYRKILCAKAELRDLKPKLLCGSGTAERQVAVYFLCGSGTTGLPSIIPCAEAECQTLSSNNILCAEAELKVSVQ